MVHGVGLEDAGGRPHKQNKRGEGRPEKYNEGGADGENENVGEQPQPSSERWDLLGKNIPHG